MVVYENNVMNMLAVNLPGVWFWSKNTEYLYLGNNENFARFFGFKRCNEMVGFSDHDLKCDAAVMAKTFQTCDKEVMDSATPWRFFEILKSASHETRIIIVNKVPLFDKYNQVKGTFGHAMDVTEPFFKLGCLLNSHSSNSGKLTPGSFILRKRMPVRYDLTARQAECLFFLLRYKTAKQIASILKISLRTVEEHIEKIKVKFRCNSKNELLEKAIDLGFLNFIPESVFDSQLSVALEF